MRHVRVAVTNFCIGVFGKNGGLLLRPYTKDVGQVVTSAADAQLNH